MINYNQYPSLLFLSYNKDNAPEELPFVVASADVRNKLAETAGYGDLFTIIASLNSLNYTSTHYWLNNLNFRKVDDDDNFRNSHFGNFMRSKPNDIQYGCICFKDGGQYVYLYLPPDKGYIKGIEDAYLCVALFKENFFIGFEEAIVKGGFSVMPTGHYESGMDVGGFLSFVTICLSFFANGTKEAGDVINQTSETIWTK